MFRRKFRESTMILLGESKETKFENINACNVKRLKLDGELMDTNLLSTPRFKNSGKDNFMRNSSIQENSF